MTDFKAWSDWIREGYYVSYLIEGVRYYEHVIARDLAHYELTWHESVASLGTSGPTVPEYLVMTKGYDEQNNTNRIWQLIFGIKGQVYVMIELPTDTHRHGIPKIPKPNSSHREVSHFEEWMSPFVEPSFLTEHIMMRPGFDRINIDIYNPEDVTITPKLNFYINNMITERIGTEQYGDLSTPQLRDSNMTNRLATRWRETLEKLYKRQIPHRPLTLQPVRSPESET